MAGKVELLNRVRHALGRAPEASSRSERYAALPELGRALAPISPDLLIGTFEAEFKKLYGQFHWAHSPSELDRILEEIIGLCGQGPAIFSRNPILNKLKIQEKIKAMGLPVCEWPQTGTSSDQELEEFRKRCFLSSIGFTGVDYALAEAGSLVLTSATEGSQLVSLAPPVHVALIRTDQVVESLEEVLASISVQPGSGISGRSTVFVTGCSRTADIEQISIRGVHGPTQVHALMVDEACCA